MENETMKFDIDEFTYYINTKEWELQQKWFAEQHIKFLDAVRNSRLGPVKRKDTLKSDESELIQMLLNNQNTKYNVDIKEIKKESKTN